MRSYLKLSKLERRRLTVFVVCLLIATVSWAFFAMSGQYFCRIRVPIRYMHTPQHKSMRALQGDTVELQLEGSGWRILQLKAQPRTRPILIDTRDLEERNYVVLTNQLKYINSQLGKRQRVAQVFPDTLFFGFSAQGTKRLPVQLVHYLGLSKPFDISGKIRIKPNYVNVTGPIDELATMQVCQTETLKVKSAKRPIKMKLPLQFASKTSFGVEIDRVEVEIPIDEFTEKQIEVPLKILNNANYDDVSLFPAKVRITFLTGLRAYGQMNADFFEASVDLNKWRQNGYRQLPVVLSRFPDYCKLVRLEPENVDFIVSK